MPSLLHGVGQGIVVDSVCSSTTTWTDDMKALRPPDAHAPAAAEPGTPSGPNPLAFLDGVIEPIIVAGIVGGGAFLLALVVARRREA